MGRISRFASSSFQLAMIYAIVVLTTMVGSYFFSARTMQRINEAMSQPGVDSLPESYIFTQLAPMILLVMIVIAGLSFFISEFVVKRINTINTIANDIIQTRDVSRRIPIENEWDDLSKMAMTLNHMLDRIEQLLQDVRTVSDNIAHDMRTPLTRLHQHIEQLEVEATQSDVEAVQTLAATISSEAQAMLGTFNALLRISNIEKGKRMAEYSQIRLCPLIEDVIELYEPLAAEKDISMELSLPGNLPETAADKHLLFQALANVVDNAIKYTPNHGVITLSVDREQDQFQVVVQDSGPGISTEQLGRVFQRFYRGDASRTAIGGNGLGLSLVKAIIELHQGTIELANQSPGLGVTIRLPIQS